MYYRCYASPNLNVWMSVLLPYTLSSPSSLSTLTASLPCPSVWLPAKIYNSFRKGRRRFKSLERREFQKWARHLLATSHPPTSFSVSDEPGLQSAGARTLYLAEPLSARDSPIEATSRKYCKL